MNKLEYAAACLTPWYPVDKNHNTNNKRGAAEIYNTYVRGAQVSSNRAKRRRGSTGVDLFYYKYDEFKPLSI